MATGPLRFRTPHIEELPTAQSRQSAGFAWVPVSGAQDDPAKNWGTTNRKRQRQSTGGQTDQQKEAVSARQQREVERRIKDLNSDNSKETVEIPKKPGQQPSGGAFKIGKTSGTKKIMSSGKSLQHHLEDEQAEIDRTGRREGEVDAPAPNAQRASKTPLHRRKPREDSSASNSPAPAVSSMPPPAIPRGMSMDNAAEVVQLDDSDGDEESQLPGLPSAAEMEALLNAPPLTYAQARASSPPPGLPPPRRFCETCGYWGRARCLKCGAMTCSVVCKDEHDQSKCLKMYA
ncbi:hypothetical protein LTR22_025305 [Elasticomyces elasticus]|nr:hypothetical protein LTR22_025305 [Elasticomyces elasticus]KAK5741102.1 hypothetical protein LTS12_024712 [Elasticomyces elasticus]